ncbi:ArsR/SmtB family transcription factor [Actinoallomurus sp. CA-150999]|uniref:ArsR/SmtB family transcription factor n=1 Tax=Actinoallomurus sp. CA-150999 TaxID=3239887 RepID=UPI003D91C3DA
MADTSAGAPTCLSPELLQDMAGTFGLLSATMRLHIVWVLAQGDRDVGTIAAQVGGTVPTVSHHLAKLKLAGLVRSRREGRHQVYLVDDPHIVTIVRQMVDRMRDESAVSRRRRGVGA